MITERMRLEIDARCRWFLVIDAQIECGNRARAIECQLDGQTAALVEHRGDGAAVKNARLSVTDKGGMVGQA